MHGSQFYIPVRRKTALTAGLLCVLLLVGRSGAQEVACDAYVDLESTIASGDAQVGLSGVPLRPHAGHDAAPVKACNTSLRADGAASVARTRRNDSAARSASAYGCDAACQVSFSRSLMRARDTRQCAAAHGVVYLSETRASDAFLRPCALSALNVCEGIEGVPMQNGARLSAGTAAVDRAHGTARSDLTTAPCGSSEEIAVAKTDVSVVRSRSGAETARHAIKTTTALSGPGQAVARHTCDTNRSPATTSKAIRPEALGDESGTAGAHEAAGRPESAHLAAHGATSSAVATDTSAPSAASPQDDYTLCAIVRPLQTDAIGRTLVTVDCWNLGAVDVSRPAVSLDLPSGMHCQGLPNAAQGVTVGLEETEKGSICCIQLEKTLPAKGHTSVSFYSPPPDRQDVFMRPIRVTVRASTDASAVAVHGHDPQPVRHTGGTQPSHGQAAAEGYPVAAATSESVPRWAAR